METKQKIMQIVFRLFAQKGTEFSLSEIAYEIGIKKASLYSHYESKEFLLRKVIEQEIDNYFYKINQEADSLEKIFFLFVDYYENNSDRLYFWKRLFLFPPKQFEESLIKEIHSLLENRYELVKELIIRDMKAGRIKNQQVEAVNIAFFSLIHGILSSKMIYNSTDITVHYKTIWENFWRGISN